MADGIFAHRAESGRQAVAVPPADVRAGVGHRPEHHRKASGGIPTGEQVAGRERRGHLLDNKPEIHVAIKPAGFAVSDLPGVHEWVSGKIAEVFATSYVEPKRYTYDFENAYLRSLDGSIAAASGPGGALVVDVAGAQRLPATNKESRTSNPYCELTYGGVTRRTATRINTTPREWNVRVVFPLPVPRGPTPAELQRGQGRRRRVRIAGRGSARRRRRGRGRAERSVGARGRRSDVTVADPRDGLVAAGRAACIGGVVRGRRAPFAPRSLGRGKDEGGEA